MQIGDIYRQGRKEFDAPENDYSRYCIIRDFDKDTVTFSVAADHQAKTGELRFNVSTFRIPKEFFLDSFIACDSSAGAGGR